MVMTYWEAKELLGRQCLRVRDLLFRGEEDPTWRLEPSLFRQKAFLSRDREARARVVREFVETFLSIRRERYPMEEGLPEDEDFILSLGQHHRLPTPLLDWTGSYLISLFFAFGGWTGNKIPTGSEVCVWQLDPKELREGSIKYQKYSDGADNRDSDELLIQRFQNSPLGIKLIKRRVWTNARQVAQDGFFTRQGVEVDSLDGFLLEQKGSFGSTLTKYVIRCENQGDVLDDLRNSMVTVDRLRTDLEGAFLETVSRVLRPWDHP